jgi:acyl-CoA synthetase (AMP-forming)/AMP-acid ligase II
VHENRLLVEAIKNPQWNGATSTSEQIIYFQTSGITGIPKLVAHSAAKLLRNATNCVARLNLTRDDRIAIPVPLYHRSGCNAESRMVSSNEFKVFWTSS